MKCKNCGSEEYYIKRVGPHTGAYCSECDKWIKWIPRDKYTNKFDDCSCATDISIDKYDIENDNDNDDCPF